MRPICISEPALCFEPLTKSRRLTITGGSDEEEANDDTLGSQYYIIHVEAMGLGSREMTRDWRRLVAINGTHGRNHRYALTYPRYTSLTYYIEWACAG